MGWLLRCEIFPADLDATADFYTRVLGFDIVRDERERVRDAGWPVVEDLTLRHWGLSDFRLLDPSGYYLRVTGHEGAVPG